MRHYVYYTYEEYGRGYIGVRSSDIDPARDTYMGSYKDKTFSPTQKIVLAEYPTREEAVEAEILLHEYYDIANNKHFANRAKQTATGWDRSGMSSWNKGKKGVYTEESLERMREAARNRVVSEEVKDMLRTMNIGKECLWKDKIAKATLGKKKTMTDKALEARKRAGETRRGKNYNTFTPEYRKKISEGCKGRKANNKGKKCWNNGVRNTYSVECPGEGWVLGGKALKNPL